MSKPQGQVVVCQPEEGPPSLAGSQPAPTAGRAGLGDGVSLLVCLEDIAKEAVCPLLDFCFSIQAKVGGHLLKWAWRKHFGCAENWLPRGSCVLSTEPTCRGASGGAGRDGGGVQWLERLPRTPATALLGSRPGPPRVSTAAGPFLNIRGPCVGSHCLLLNSFEIYSPVKQFTYFKHTIQWLLIYYITNCFEL